MTEIQDHDAERICLALWFSGRADSVELARRLEPSWFLHSGRADACRAARAADAAGCEVTPEEVCRRMSWGGDRVKLIGEAIDAMTAGGAQWVVRLREAWQRREVTRSANKLIAAIADGDDLREEALRFRRQLDELTHDEHVETWADVVARIVSQRLDGRPAVARIPTGLRPFDDRIGGGLGRGWLVVVLAGPKTGKTAFAVNGVAATVASSGGRVLVVSAEMSDDELADRALTARARGSNDPSELLGAADALSAWDIAIDTRSRSVEGVVAAARTLAREKPLSLIVVDYLQLFSSGLDNRTRDIEHTITSLKLLARELNVPVLLLVQPTAEARRRGKINASDSKGSGAPEEAADLLVIMERPSQTEEPETLRMRWPAFRHGTAGQLIHGEIRWDGPSLTVVESV